MKDSIKLLEPVLQEIILTTIFKVDKFEIEVLPDFTKEIHVYGECISSENPAEIYIHGDFRESELDVIRSTYCIGNIIKVSGSYNIFTGGLLIVSQPVVTELSKEIVRLLEKYFK